jgi:hypothetical protein
MARTKSKPSPTGVYVARSSGVFKIRGTMYRYARGQTFPAGHPLLRVRPDSFAPLTFDTEPVGTPETRA